MRLGRLIEGLDYLDRRGDLEREIGSIHYDSRQVKPGSLFAAIRGLRQDGHDFIPRALAAGASTLVVECDLPHTSALPETGISMLKVHDSRLALAQIACAFYGHPSRKLRLIGVTGTNGKTTTTYLVESLLLQAGYRVGVIGTINYRFAGNRVEAERTTPESLDLQKVLGDMVSNGVEYVVMEVSSHSLELKRVAGCEFDLAIFTNLTHDHLDFHGDLEHYLNAKLLLFSDLGKDGKKTTPKLALINTDDPFARRVKDVTSTQTWGYGLGEGADIRASILDLSLEGIESSIESPRGSLRIHSRLIGEHNVYNILGAVGVGIWEEIPPPVIGEGIARVSRVPGRWEMIQGGQKFAVVVDYAHTADALERTLKAARRLCRGRVITVFGCGGDRDRAKRPIMGEVAARCSDYFIITSDNPRSEDPEKIVAEIEQGVRKTYPGRDDYDKITDRREAIEKAIYLARENDLVMIAGKGHETYQILGEGVIPFDDREVVKICIEKRLKQQG